MRSRDDNIWFSIGICIVLIVGVILFSMWRYDKCVEGGLDPTYCLIDSCS
jgi:hypothetical protein